MRFIDLKTRVEATFISPPTVLCIGDFDGVHLGHRQLVASVLTQIQKEKQEHPNTVSGAWFFDSNTYKAAREIYTIEEKLNVFASLGLDYAIVADFDEMKSLSPESFVYDVLQSKCNCIHAVCGENFRFGAKAAGDSNALKSMMNGNATVVPLLSVDGDQIISSTYIRELLAEGNIKKANSLLGANYTVYETVNMMSIFAARSVGVSDIVLTGNLTRLDFCREKTEFFNSLKANYGVNFHIPPHAEYATVIGAALSAEISG